MAPALSSRALLSSKVMPSISPFVSLPVATPPPCSFRETLAEMDAVLSPMRWKSSLSK